MEEDSVFQFNRNFKSKLYRIKVLQNMVTKSDAQVSMYCLVVIFYSCLIGEFFLQANHGATLQKIGEDRKHQIEAAIVRF